MSTDNVPSPPPVKLGNENLSIILHFDFLFLEFNICTLSFFKVEDDEDSCHEIRIDVEIERNLLEILCEISPNLPCNSQTLYSNLAKKLSKPVSQEIVDNLLQKFATQQLIRYK